MIALDLTPTEEAQIDTLARETGLESAEYVKMLIKEHLPPVQPSNPPISEKNKAAIALLKSWIDDAPTDPEEIRQAEADFNETMENLNRYRLEDGERPILP